MRTISLVVILAVLSSAAIARQPDAFDACARQKDPAARLACFDREVATRARAQSARTPATPLKASPGTMSSAATAASAAAPSSAANRDVGLDARQLRRARRERGEAEPPPPAPIVARVVRVIPREPLISAFELDNGQVWEQSESMRFSAQPKEKVTIRYGVLGAFFLKNAAGAVVRVHRLR